MHKKIVGLGLLFCLIGFGPLLASSDTFYTQGAWGNTSGGLQGWVSGDGTGWSWGSDSYSSDRSNVSFIAAGSSSLDGARVNLGQLLFSNNTADGNVTTVSARLSLNLLFEGYSQTVSRDLAVTVKNDYSSRKGDRPDSLTLAAPAEPFTFTLGSYAYTLTLLGFSSDGLNVDAAPFTFSVAEGDSATRHLLASVSRTAVPIPPTAILLGSGLLGLLGFRRRV